MMQEKEIFATDKKRLIVLAIYDITDNKKRLAMVKFLEQYAIRVQKSCFEGFLTPLQCKTMEKEASKLIDEKTDSLRIYILQDHTLVKSWGRGDIKDNDVIVY